MCHSVALRDCLGRKNALYKHLILYFYFCYNGSKAAPLGARGKAPNQRVRGEDPWCRKLWSICTLKGRHKTLLPARQNRLDMMTHFHTFSLDESEQQSKAATCQFPSLYGDRTHFCPVCLSYVRPTYATDNSYWAWLLSRLYKWMNQWINKSSMYRTQ